MISGRKNNHFTTKSASRSEKVTTTRKLMTKETFARLFSPTKPPARNHHNSRFPDLGGHFTIFTLFRPDLRLLFNNRN